MLLPDDAAAWRPSRPTFELRCADVHPFGCEEALRARSANDLVALACEHGGLVHGFTPAYYSSERLASIAAAVTTALAEPVPPRSTREAANYARGAVVVDDVRHQPWH